MAEGGDSQSLNDKHSEVVSEKKVLQASPNHENLPDFSVLSRINGEEEQASSSVEEAVGITASISKSESIFNNNPNWKGNLECRIGISNKECIIQNCHHCIIENNSNCTIQDCDNCLIQGNVYCQIMNNAILKVGRLSTKNCTILDCDSCKIFDNEDCVVRSNRLCTINDNFNSYIALHEHAVIKGEESQELINTKEWFIEKFQESSNERPLQS